MCSLADPEQRAWKRSARLARTAGDQAPAALQPEERGPGLSMQPAELVMRAISNFPHPHSSGVLTSPLELFPALRGSSSFLVQMAQFGSLERESDEPGNNERQRKGSPQKEGETL